MENNNIANYVNIFACVRFKSLRAIKMRIIQMLQFYERAYLLYIVTYKICQMLQSWDKLLSSSALTEIHRDCGITVRSESDFVQCQAKMRAFAFRICSEFKQIELNWNRIVHQNALWCLVFSTIRPWNKQISAPDASQPSSHR